MSIAGVVDLLRCPLCADGLTLAERSLRCPQRHTFDLAKQGYVNLLGRSTPANADTAEMVSARERFLGAGHYLPIAEAVSSRLTGCRTILDAGGGSGYYLAHILSDQPDARGVVTDVSVAAVRRAAKVHPRAAAIVADTWKLLPIQTQVIDAVTCIFAPRNPAEFARVLRPGGALVVVTPNPAHLIEAREALGLLGLQDDKLSKVQHLLSGYFEPIASTRVRRKMLLDPETLNDLVAMGPNAFHQHQEIDAEMELSLDVEVSLFRRPTRGS